MVALTFQSLTPFPVPVGFARCRSGVDPKDVGMASDHLFAHGPQEGAEVALAMVFGDQRKEEHSVEDIPELLLEIPVAMPPSRLKHFPGFLNKIGQEG